MSGIPVVGAVFGGLSAFKEAGDQRDRFKSAAEIKQAEADEATARLSIRLALQRRTNKRAEGAREATVASSGIQRSGSALDVIADAATEEAIQTEILKFEGQSIISAKTTEASLLTQEAGRISPLFAGLVGAFAGFQGGGGQLPSSSS